LPGEVMRSHPRGEKKRYLHYQIGIYAEEELPERRKARSWLGTFPVMGPFHGSSKPMEIRGRKNGAG